MSLITLCHFHPAVVINIIVYNILKTPRCIANTLFLCFAELGDEAIGSTKPSGTAEEHTDCEKFDPVKEEQPLTQGTTSRGTAGYPAFTLFCHLKGSLELSVWEGGGSER